MLTICLYLSKLDFAVLLSNGPSVYIKMKSTVFPDQYEVKVLLMNQTGSLLCEKDG